MPRGEALACAACAARACLLALRWGAQAEKRRARYNQSKVLEVGPVSGRAAPLLDDSPLLPGLQMNFQAAAARER